MHRELASFFGSIYRDTYFPAYKLKLNNGTLCSQSIKLALLVLLFGVGIASVTDLKLNLVGSVLSLLAIATTCVGQIAFIVLSCLIAVSVNFSTFLVIGTTSPVTYQVLGHLKTCLVLSFGYTLLHDPFTARNILGILVAIFGMALYSYFSVKESKKKSAGDVLPLSQTKDTEDAPLLANGHHQDKENGETKKANGVPIATKNTHA